MNSTNPTRRIVAATFSTPDGSGKAAAAVMSANPGKIANAAVLTVKPDGTPKFFETKDWGAGRGALLGGAIGLLGGPLGVLAGSGIGILATKLRDAGFDDDELSTLGRTLKSGQSAVVFDVAADVVDSVRSLLEPLGAARIVDQPVDSRIIDLFVTVTTYTKE